MTDRFNRNYKQLTEESQKAINNIKYVAAELEKVICETHSSRESSLALTNLEQAVFWAVKAIVLRQEKELPGL